ncbi:MAG TPA: hypothetical protein VK928_10235 [Longimicrobiales bacterium]|nr:hypothetical protein [Longimicrobiales bacterium]
MNKSFTISRADILAADPAGLLNECIKGTGSEVEAASVMRSLQRMGSDPSIESYDVIQVAGRRMNGGAATSAWRVRADRGNPEPNGDS